MSKVNRLNCPLCWASVKEAKTVFSKNSYSVNRCDDCKSLFIGEIPSTEELSKAYSESYYKGGIYENYAANEKGRKKHYTKVLHSLSTHFSVGAKIIELGSATGDFLDVAKDQGYNPVGIELSQYSSKIASNKGHVVFNGTLEDNVEHVTKEGPFDAVFMHDVFEHLTEPREVLVTLEKIMKPEAILYLNTLNIESPTVKYFGEKWSQYFPPIHLIYPSKNSLKRVLYETGFDLIKQTTKGPLFYDVGGNKLLIYLHYVMRFPVYIFGWGYTQTVVAKKRPIRAAEHPQSSTLH